MILVVDDGRMLEEYKFQIKSGRFAKLILTMIDLRIYNDGWQNNVLKGGVANGFVAAIVMLGFCF